VTDRRNNSRYVGSLMVDEHPALHLLDVENMLGGFVTPGLVAELWGSYRELAPVLRGDHVIAGFCPATAPAGLFDLPSAVRKLVGGHGADSADRVLIDSVDVRHVARRYERVIIGSGDARFAPLAWTLRSLGVRVLYVDTKASSVSWLLHRSCQGRVRVPAPAAVQIHRSAIARAA